METIDFETETEQAGEVVASAINEYKQRRREYLADVYSSRTAQVDRAPISNATRACLHLKCLVDDVYGAFLSLTHYLLTEDDTSKEHERVSDLISPLRDLANEYLINSINDNFNNLTITEI